MKVEKGDFVKAPPGEYGGCVEGGKIYEVIEGGNNSFTIVLSKKLSAFCLLYKCSHLCGGNWILLKNKTYELWT